MRIHSIALRNYRIHRNLSVQLDPNRTLIGGPNESGKSTLIEAVHRGFFLKAKVTGEIQKSMIPADSGGAPEIELEFAVGTVRYHLAKRFSGSTGTTKLTEIGGPTWLGEEAESRLAALLKVEGMTGGKGMVERLAQQWSHLWVWQGSSNEDPSEYANLQKTGLLQKLQQVGGAAALQSDLDSRLTACFAARKESIFTQAGKSKAGSDLEKAEQELAQAQEHRSRAFERLERLRQAACDFNRAENEVGRTTRDLERLKPQEMENERSLAAVADLCRRELAQIPEAKAAAEKHQQLLESHEQIGRLCANISRLEASLKPSTDQTVQLAAARERAKSEEEEEAGRLEEAIDKARQARLQRDLFASCVSSFEKGTRLEELETKEKKGRLLREEMARLGDDLAKTADVSSSKLKKLQKLQSDLSESEAALKAMAAGIEILEASGPVQVGKNTLAPGEELIVADPTEIRFGDSLRLRIRPGGGASLQQARERVRQGALQLQEKLDELGLGSLSEAADACAKRADLQAKIEKAESGLQNLEGAHFAEELAQARTAMLTAEAELARRRDQARDIALPKLFSDAVHCLRQAESAVERAEKTEEQLKRSRGAKSKILAETEEALSQHRQGLEKLQHELTGLYAQLRLLKETAGEEEARRAALAQAWSAKVSAEAVLAEIRKDLARLAPGQLERDAQRFRRARAELEAGLQQAEKDRAVAEAALRLDGSDDPEEALQLADARVQLAEETLTGVRRKAEAIQLLHELFLQEQRALADQFTQPLAERVGQYLQCIFGPDCSVAITLADDGFTGLQLIRAQRNSGAVPFGQLSGGAREQLAAAVRLAMAEVLAADHDGCLPLVFDDAFAYSDPDRVQVLQRMLDLGAARGLQIIVLTCNPSDYAALGARQLLLNPANAAPLPSRQSANENPVSP